MQAKWLQRWRWEFALAGCVSLAIGILVVSEVGHRQLTGRYESGIQSIWMGARLNDLSARLADAETGQRSFLLTSRPEELEPYKQAVPVIRRLLDELRPHYAVHPDPEADKVFGALVTAIGAKLGEIELTLQLTDRSRADRALEVVESGMGRRTMEEIRFLLDDLARREDDYARNIARDWRSSLAISRLGIAGVTALNLVLLVLLFAGVKRDWRRARDRQDVLNRTVRDRTRQLDMLASRLQEAGEAEKSELARELHDELGALLTASKMDLSWVHGRLGRDHSHTREKLARVAQNLDQGLMTMRRIVEGLRPSTLCSFGLSTAARELAGQIAERAGWVLDIDLPESDPDLSPDVEIALYRVLQESLTNAAKYAQARRVRVSIGCNLGWCKLEVEDDGAGFRTSDARPDAQGVFGMRHRIEARGGTFELRTKPGQGTRIRVIIPLARVQPRAASPRPCMPDELPEAART